MVHKVIERETVVNKFEISVVPKTFEIGRKQTVVRLPGLFTITKFLSRLLSGPPVNFCLKIRERGLYFENSGQRTSIIFDLVRRLHAVRFKGGRSQEEWISEHLQDSYFKKIDEGECLEIRRFDKDYLKPVIAEVFVADIDANGQLEIVAYSEFGGIVFYRAENYKRIWSSRPC